MKDFFISYTRTDQTWAEWIAWTLEAAGYSTVIQAWDFRPGSNFVLEMQRAATEANRTIAVLSQKYLESTFTQPEWAAAFTQDPQGKKQKFIPVRIEACQLTGLLASIVFLDLVGLPENDARTALLGAFSIRNKPASAPAFPGTRTPPAPGVSPTQPAYPGATEATSAPIAEVLSSVAGNADNNRQLSAAQRLQFMRQLNEIVPQQFNMLLFAVSPPAGLIPPMPAAQGDRTSALLTWAEAPGGCGLSVLQEVLKTIVTPPVGPSQSSVPPAAGLTTAANTSNANSSLPVWDAPQTSISPKNSQETLAEPQTSSRSSQEREPHFRLPLVWILLPFVLVIAALLGFWIYRRTIDSEQHPIITTHQAPIASPTGTQIRVQKPAPRTAPILRISFLVNAADEAAAKKIGSLRSEFEAAGFEWQPPKTDVKNSYETEIRVSGSSDHPLAEYVQEELKQKYSINSTIQISRDVGSGYVQVSLAKGALK